jgi:hypothetical protein
MLCSQLDGKWKHACQQYRLQHPSETFPASKANVTPYGNRESTRLLPVEFAEDKMRVWIPWAIAKLQEELDSLARQFSDASLDSVSEVAADPEVEVLDGEYV